MRHLAYIENDLHPPAILHGMLAQVFSNIRRPEHIVHAPYSCDPFNGMHTSYSK